MRITYIKLDLEIVNGMIIDSENNTSEVIAVHDVDATISDIPNKHGKPMPALNSSEVKA